MHLSPIKVKVKMKVVFHAPKVKGNTETDLN